MLVENQSESCEKSVIVELDPCWIVPAVNSDDVLAP